FVASGGGNLQDVTIHNTGALHLQALTIDGALTASSNSDIDQAAGVLDITGTASFTGGSGGTVTLTNANVFHDTVSFVASSGQLQDVSVNSAALDLGTTNIAGDLHATAATGDITNSGALIIGGTSTFTVNGAATRSISVNNGGNNFTGSVTFAG